MTTGGTNSCAYGGMDEPEIKIIDVFICKLRKKLAGRRAARITLKLCGAGDTRCESRTKTWRKCQPKSPETKLLHFLARVLRIGEYGAERRQFGRNRAPPQFFTEHRPCATTNLLDALRLSISADVRGGSQARSLGAYRARSSLRHFGDLRNWCF